MAIPSIDEVRALEGRDLATLSEHENATLDFYRTQGRKFDVRIAIISEADPEELERAKTQREADLVMQSAPSIITVAVGDGARSAWAERT